MRIDAFTDLVRTVVEAHRLEKGVYARWLWQDKDGSRDLGPNPYGCADAANLLYTISDFPRDPAERAAFVDTLRAMQDETTGLFHERTHHPIHTTAHCLSALELFDAGPLYPPAALLPYLDIETLYTMLEGLDWIHKPWPQSHRGAGLFSALFVTRNAPLDWQDAYFGWLAAHNDPSTGIGLKGAQGQEPLQHHLNGWFHYCFNHEVARRPLPHPEALVDACIALYQCGDMDADFGRYCNFMEIDWIFCLNRASRQTGHRRPEALALLADFASAYIPRLLSLDPAHDESLNDLHLLFGAACAVAELQQALPGAYPTTLPLRLVLDRRPFI